MKILLAIFSFFTITVYAHYSSPTPTPHPTPPPKHCYRDCDDDVHHTPRPTGTPQPTPDATSTPTPTPVAGCTFNCPGDPNPGPANGRFSTTDAPVCTDGSTVKLAANPFVVRAPDGDFTKAIVHFFLTDGDGAIVWYKQVGDLNWTFSVPKDQVAPFINADHFASVPVNDLKPNEGYTFGITQTKGCGGGEYVTAVVVDGAVSRVFRFSYWKWE